MPSEFHSMSTAPKDGRLVLMKIQEPAGGDYAVASGNPDGWEYVAEGRWENGWQFPIRGEPVGWKLEEPGDEVFMRLDGSHRGFEPEKTTAPNGEQS
jgi:hypothetical protein